MDEHRDFAVGPERLAQLRQRVRDLMPRTLGELADLARIPSVSLPSSSNLGALAPGLAQ